jgi:hypothetical protein
MALTYVGGNTASGAGNTNITISLTALTGGSGSTALEGDIVIVALNYSGNTNANVPPSLVTSGYSSIASLFVDDSNETNLVVARKIMGSTPDTDVEATVSGGSSGRYYTGVVHVWRGVDQTTPLDVTSTTNTGTNSSAADCPSITPTTSGSVVLAVGGNAIANGAYGINGAPSGYTNLKNVTGSVYSSTAIASKAWTSGAENPGAFSVGGTSISDSWAAVTIALRERPGVEFSISESVSLTETITNLRARNFSVSETTTLTESITSALGKIVTIVESISLTETLNTTRTFLVNIAESVGLTEVLAQVKKKWNDTIKSSTSWTNSDKSSAPTWTEDSKSSTTWTETDKS